MTTRIKLRRDTAANWTENDPVLALGEAGYDTTNNELRVGDGTTVWSGLESIGGTGNKITALKTYSLNENDGSAQTFTYTTGSIAVQMGNNNGLYLDDLLSRWVQYFDGDTTFPYNYSDVSLVINPNSTNLSTTVTNVVSDGNDPTLYTITLGTTNPGPIVVDDIDFNYNYINTIGLDIVNDYFGMSTGDDDITIRSGQDINLVAADDFYVYAGDNLELQLVNLDNSDSNDGIDIRTQTTSSNYTWTFRFDGNLELPEGLALPTQTNTGYDYSTTLTGPTLRLSNNNTNQVIVTGPATTENNPSAQRIVIQGQRGFGVWSTSTYTVGEGGDVYIWGGTGGESQDWTGGRTGGSGGDVKLRGGQGQDHDGGYVRIEGGNTEIYNNTSTGYGGFVEITGGDVVGQAGDPSDPSKGGNVTITGGRAYSATTQSGVVGIITGGITNPDVAGENYWEFGNSGTLTFPEGSILSGTRENVTVTLDQFNDGGFTGTQVFSKVSDILYQVLPSGPTMELVSNVWYLKVDVATYYNSADLITWAESAGGLPTPVGTIGTLATTNLTLDANTWTFSGNGALTLPGDILDSEGVSVYIDTPDNQWIVDPSNTATYTEDGSIHKPFKTITAALAHIEVLIAAGQLTQFDETANIVLSPQFIILTSSTTEDVNLTRGHIYIVGDTPDAGHVPIWIQGHVTITPGGATKAANSFGLFHVAVLPTGNFHGVKVTGSAACRVYLEDVYVYQGTNGYSCVYQDNSDVTTKLELVDCHTSRAGGSTYLVDIQSAYCLIHNLETNGVGQVLNFANSATGTMLQSTIDANTGSVITLSGTVQFGMGECILNNTGVGANTHGVSMSGSSTMQFGVCTFNIPAGDGSNRAINGTATNTVLYTGPVFQYGSTNKISTAITLVPLTTTFTAV